MAADPQRHDAIRKSIEAHGFSALASVTPTEVLLLTGYCPVMGASLAVFGRSGKVFAIVPEDELDLAKATSDAEFISYQPSSLHKITDPAEAAHEPLKKMAGQLHLDPGPIGTNLEGGAQPASYQSVHRYRDSLVPLLHAGYPKAEIVSADAVFDQLKSVKTHLEIDKIRHACSLAGVGFQQAAQGSLAGRREDDIAADVSAAFARVANHGFERGAGYFFCMSGPNSYKASGAYARTRTRRVEEGDLVMIHANTVGDGYWTDITRTHTAGPANPQQRKMQDAIAEARKAALDSIRPGVSAAAVDAAARDVLTRHGFGEAFKHPTGHGVGFAAADGDALPRLHPKSPDVLQAGMTFNVEPAIYIEGVGGMRHCDVVACTESGAEVLTSF